MDLKGLSVKHWKSCRSKTYEGMKMLGIKLVMNVDIHGVFRTHLESTTLQSLPVSRLLQPLPRTSPSRTNVPRVY